jgi:putative NADH-flavin reductase
MKITVFGAAGRTGRHVLAEGTRRGHQLVAFTRRPRALTGVQGLVGIVHGEGRDADAVRRAVDGTDAVISIIPGGRPGDPHRATQVTGTIIQAMTDLGIRRLVVTSAYPVVADRPRLPVMVLRTLLATAFSDVSAMEVTVTGSGLEWTIVRLNRLTDGPGTGTVRTSRDLFAKPRAISRADVATVLLDVVEDDTLARAALNVSGG